jgi:hypothetical protein
MVERTRYEELARQLGDLSVVKRDIQRVLPSDCSAGPSAVLTLIGRHGDMRGFRTLRTGPRGSCASRLSERNGLRASPEDPRASSPSDWATGPKTRSVSSFT